MKLINLVNETLNCIFFYSRGIPWTSSTKPLEESTLNIPVHRSFGRSLRSISDEDVYPSANEYLTNFTNDLNFLSPVCPMLINTTESLRFVIEVSLADLNFSG